MFQDVGWSLSYQSPRDPELIDAALLAAGKALHLVNMFEAKCKYVLAIANLASIVKDDPVLSLTEAMAGLPNEKMLAGTLQDLSETLHSLTDNSHSALEKAKQARNFIAHEGAAFGEVWIVSQHDVFQHLDKLRAAVTDVAEGDNLVSSWMYAYEEKEPAPRLFIADYPRMVDQWVFGHLENYWAEDDS